MTKHLHMLAAVLLAALCAGCNQAVQTAGKAQANNVHETAPASGPVAMIAIKQPDWEGVWQAPFGGGAGAIKMSLPTTPEYAAKWAALQKVERDGGDVESNAKRCIPNGMPMMMGTDIAFLFSSNRITIDTPTGARRIWTDGRKHTDDNFLLDTFTGESIGHWEADTLVVDTIAIRRDAEMTYGFRGDHMHVTERIHLTDPDTMQVETTVADPKVLANPWITTKTYKRHRDVVMDNNYCIAAYDRSVNPRTGEQSFDLTPPPEEGIGTTPR